MIGIIILALIIIFIIPVVFTIAGLVIRKRTPKTANVFFILAVVYTILIITVMTVGVGICSGGLG